MAEVFCFRLVYQPAVPGGVLTILDLGLCLVFQSDEAPGWFPTRTSSCQGPLLSSHRHGNKTSEPMRKGYLCGNEEQQTKICIQITQVHLHLELYIHSWNKAKLWVRNAEKKNSSSSILLQKKGDKLAFIVQAETACLEPGYEAKSICPQLSTNLSQWCLGCCYGVRKEGLPCCSRTIFLWCQKNW